MYEEFTFQLSKSTMILPRNTWIYHFPTPRQVTLRCPRNEVSPLRTQVLVNGGMLFNASACHVSTENLHIYPTIRGCMQTEHNRPHNFVPDKVPIISQHVSHQLQELATPTLQAIDSLNLISQRLCIQWTSILRYTCVKLHENHKLKYVGTQLLVLFCY